MESRSAQSQEHPSRLPITLDYELLVEIADLKSRVKSLLVGMMHNQYIIAKIFPNDLVGVFNSEGIKKSQISVMYRYLGAVYSFDTTVQHVVTFPDRLLFLKYPRRVKKYSAPDKIRHQCNLPSQTMLGNNIIDMSIIDISQNGYQCTINTTGENGGGLYDHIDVDKRIDIFVQFQDIGERYDLVGTIRNIRKDVNHIQFGVMFGEMPPVVKKKVEDYIALISNGAK